MRRLVVLGASASVGVGIFFGCVGDDPVPNAAPDASASSSSSGGSSSSSSSSGSTSSSSSSSSGSSGTPSCAGQPFATPVAVKTSAISATVSGFVWGPRIQGAKAYFAATPTSGGIQRIYRADFIAGTNPEITNAAELATLNATSANAKWSPMVTSEGTHLVYADGNLVGDAGRELFAAAANSSKTDFGAGASLSSLNLPGAVDDADPFVVGSPTKAIYFASGDVAGQSIFRATATPALSFGTKTKVDIPCQKASCGTPVVPADEKTILFAAYDASFQPQIYEATMDVSKSPITVGALVDHSKVLGVRYPSWISDDGCSVVLAIGTPPELQYATHTPK